MNKSPLPTPVFGPLLKSEAAISRLTRLVDGGKENPKHVMRRIGVAAAILVGALVVLAIACAAIWASENPGGEFKTVLGLVAILSLVVAALAFITVISVAIQGLVIQHLALSEQSLNLQEAGQELLETEEILERGLEESRTQPPGFLENVIKEALGALRGIGRADTQAPRTSRR